MGDPQIAQDAPGRPAAGAMADHRSVATETIWAHVAALLADERDRLELDCLRAIQMQDVDRLDRLTIAVTAECRDLGSVASLL